MTLDEDGARALARRMREAHIMRIDEMPRIELYLDQVLALVSQSLSFMALPGEELITGSMVNNYVKQRVVPAPRRRRGSGHDPARQLHHVRDQLLHLQPLLHGR